MRVLNVRTARASELCRCSGQSQAPSGYRGGTCFVVKDSAGYEDDPGPRSAAKLVLREQILYSSRAVLWSELRQLLGNIRVRIENICTRGRITFRSQKAKTVRTFSRQYISHAKRQRSMASIASWILMKASRMFSVSPRSCFSAKCSAMSRRCATSLSRAASSL
jgi:hypothetical protein